MDNTYNRAYKPLTNIEEEGSSKDDSKEGEEEEEEEDNSDNDGTSNGSSNSKDKVRYRPGDSSLYYKDMLLYKQ
ncbi:hypothetical protein P8C59_003527 [Phyllachora maydis]|uniref:Uncharacterized protein n=1 Tax=Phyllachora maydis TaxID=1825666 RepID=A0AAD9MCI5_9PEZI|nr:hypothetical protein P8C59_003527 [Phyllachora maydis]